MTEDDGSVGVFRSWFYTPKTAIGRAVVLMEVLSLLFMLFAVAYAIAVVVGT